MKKAAQETARIWMLELTMENVKMMDLDPTGPDADFSPTPGVAALEL